jgi:hypothetical protein
MKQVHLLFFPSLCCFEAPSNSRDGVVTSCSMRARLWRVEMITPAPEAHRSAAAADLPARKRDTVDSNNYCQAHA